MVPAESIEPCLISQQCVLIATKTTDIINNKDISTLNVTKHWEVPTIQEQYSLFLCVWVGGWVVVVGEGGGGINDTYYRDGEWWN